MITFSCPSCKQTLEVEERGAGLMIPCPTCSKQITIPWKVEPVVVGPAVTASIYDHPPKKADEIPPVIHAGVICLLIYVTITFVSLILFRSHLQTQMKAIRQMSMNPTSLLSLQAALQHPISAQMQVLPAVSWLGMIFGATSLICAVIAMATDHVSKGLALLIGASLAIALYYFGINHIADGVLQEQMGQLNQQLDQMQLQMQQIFGGRPSR
jgi:hypothetical protein